MEASEYQHPVGDPHQDTLNPNQMVQAEALSSDSEEESEGAELRAAATAYKATAKRCAFPQMPQMPQADDAAGCLQMTSVGCV